MEISANQPHLFNFNISEPSKLLNDLTTFVLSSIDSYAAKQVRPKIDHGEMSSNRLTDNCLFFKSRLTMPKKVIPDSENFGGSRDLIGILILKPSLLTIVYSHIVW